MAVPRWAEAWGIPAGTCSPQPWAARLGVCPGAASQRLWGLLSLSPCWPPSGSVAIPAAGGPQCSACSRRLELELQQALASAPPVLAAFHLLLPPQPCSLGRLGRKLLVEGWGKSQLPLRSVGEAGRGSTALAKPPSWALVSPGCLPCSTESWGLPQAVWGAESSDLSSCREC